MNHNFIAKAEVTIHAPATRIWNALTKPELIKHYLFGTQVTTDWQVGSPITYKGQWKGQTYEDKGTILQFKPTQRLQYSHYSPLSGLPDKPEHYHTVTIDLSGNGTETEVMLTQNHNATEAARTHSEKNWNLMLAGLKKFVEK